MASIPAENRTSLASYEKCVLCGCSKDQYDELKKRVADSKNRITMMETDYLQSTLKAENDYATCKEELRVMKERYARLEESHAALQRTNQELEDKVLQVASKYEKEKQFLGKEMMTLTSRLVDVRCKLGEKEEENVRLKKDCELAVQLLQCAPSSNYLTHKVSSLPHDLQYRVHKVMEEENIAAREDNEETQLYLPNDERNANLASRVYDRVSTAVITKAMRMREEEENTERVTSPVKYTDTKERGTQTIQPFQGSLSAKTKKNMMNGYSDKGSQITLGKESLENVSGAGQSDEVAASQNLMDSETADLIDFSSTASVCLAENDVENEQSKTQSDNQFVDQSSSSMLQSSNSSSVGSSRRNSFDNDMDQVSVTSNVQVNRSTSEESVSIGEAYKTKSTKQKAGTHSSREIEYGPDLQQLCAHPVSPHLKQPNTLRVKRGVNSSLTFSKNRGPIKPGTRALHSYSNVSVPQATTPPSSPAHFTNTGFD
ncbi:CAP-Gly domain-containing linker protein 1-like [Ptychodera flava]|uniref:CAP-Gly domain-containing linker protein 1-like n=1 Tax=Ptychodera flava TaxID=63121 RepID=UPI003969DFC8